MPRDVRFTAEISRDQRRPAVYFATLDGKIDLGAALIAADNRMFGTEDFVEQPRDIKSSRAGARTAAARRLLGFADVVDGFIRRVGAHVMNDVVLLRRADPGDL